MIGMGDERFSIRQQCDLLGVNRSGWYYEPVPESADNLLYMRLLDEQYTEDPSYGVERMTAYLCRQGYEVNAKRIRRLLRIMGLDAIYQKPNTSKTNPEHKVYPYLLRGVSATHCDHIWSTDITYIRLEKVLCTWWRSSIGLAVMCWAGHSAQHLRQISVLKQLVSYWKKGSARYLIPTRVRSLPHQDLHSPY